MTFRLFSSQNNADRASPKGLAQVFVPYCVVSIDPGISTGFVMIEVHSYEVACIKFMETISMRQAFDRVISANPSKVLIERMPSKIEIELLGEYADMLKLRDVYNCELILPGSWKPLAKKRKWTHSMAKTDHEKDAYNMLRWWFVKEKGIDIGELKCA